MKSHPLDGDGLEPVGEGGGDAGAEPGEEAVKAEVGAVGVDAIDVAAGTFHLPKVAALQVVFAEAIHALDKGAVAEVEAAMAEGAPKEFNGTGADVEDVFAHFGRISRLENADVFEATFKQGRVFEDLAVEETEVFPIVNGGDLFGAAEVDYPKLAVFDEEISRMRVGVEEVEGVDLVMVEVPESLADAVAFGLAGGRGIGEFIERDAIDPVEGKNAAGGVFGVVDGETNVDEMRGAAGEVDGALEFEGVIGFFEQAGFDFGDVGGDLAFFEAHDLQGNGFDEAEVGGEAFGDAGVLDFDGESAVAQGGFVNLADAGSVGGGLGEGVEEVGGRFAKFTAKGADNERVGEGRGGVLGLGKFFGVSGREEVFVDAEHLRELQRAAFEFAKGVEDAAGVLFVERGGVAAAAEGALAVVLEVIDADLGTGSGEGGDAGEFAAWDAVLVHEKVVRRLRRFSQIIRRDFFSSICANL